MALLSALYDLPNNVLEKQKGYQNSPRPIMLRGARGPLYVGIYGAMFTAGMVGTTYAIVSMVTGNKPE